MMSIERRWAGAVLEGFAGETPKDGLVPLAGEADYVDAYATMLKNGSFLAGVGMRIAMLFCVWSPLWLTGRPRTLSALAGPERAALLDRLLHHRIFLVAELTLLLKLCACMALFRSPTIRARSSYDSVPEVLHGADSKAQPKRGLPVVVREEVA